MRKFSRTSGVVVAASAASALAAAAYEFEHRRISRADLSESDVTIRRLWDLQPERENLEAIGEGLLAEWGPTAFVGFEDVREMASKAGRSIFIAQRRHDDGEMQTGVLQTIRLDLGGDPVRLAEEYPTFADLTSHEAWKHSLHKGGDTLVLLQITVLGKQERGAGLGSQLRNAGLYVQPNEVQYALTTTPVDREAGTDLILEDKSTFTAAMRFHIRGGATPAYLLPDYKASAEDEVLPSKHAENVVVMRYERDAEGVWPTTKPVMRLRRAGPLQQRLSLTWRRVKRMRRPRRRR